MSKRTERNARRASTRPVGGVGDYQVVVLHEGEPCPICAEFGGPPLAHSLVAGWASSPAKTATGQPWQADPSNAVPLYRSDDVNAT